MERYIPANSNQTFIYPSAILMLVSPCHSISFQTGLYRYGLDWPAWAHEVIPSTIRFALVLSGLVYTHWVYNRTQVPYQIPTYIGPPLDPKGYTVPHPT